VIARVMTSTAIPGSLDTAIGEWPLHMEAFRGKGMVACYLLVDRETNRIMSITIWESADAQQRNSISPEQLKGRSEFTKLLTAPPVPSVYEVAGFLQ
jgi:heme-degrading monooxygenase HmoA